VIAPRVLIVAGLALVACATADSGAQRPLAFAGIRRVALARVADRHDAGAPRAKDPLDALADSLALRGVDTRLVEPERLGRLHERLDARIATAPDPAPGRFGRHVEFLGQAAADAVRGLGVDAIAMYHRFDRNRSAFPDAPAGTPFAARPTAGLRRPLGALSVVDAEGNAVWFDWGAPSSELDPSAPANAAEAIDLLLHVLAGEPLGD
jgi:hypothetical protein